MMNNTFEQIETYENIFDKDERKLLIAMTLKTLRLRAYLCRRSSGFLRTG